MSDFTHIDRSGKAKMVDVSEKTESLRTAVAEGYITVGEEIIKKIRALQLKKGDVAAAVKIAGINAAKKTWELIPLCHQIKLTAVDVDFEISEREDNITVRSTVAGFDRTGVEMEALSAVSVGLLTIYDMCKSVSKDMVIGKIELLKKTGGKSDVNRTN